MIAHTQNKNEKFTSGLVQVSAEAASADMVCQTCVSSPRKIQENRKTQF